MKEIRLLAAPVIVKDGRITISTYILKLFDHDDSRLTPADNIIIHLDPSKEPKFSPHPSGGWCSPPYAVIEEAEKAGVELEDIEIIKCKCQKQVEKVPTLTNEDTYSLEQCGHASGCPKAKSCHDVNSHSDFNKTPWCYTPGNYIDPREFSPRVVPSEATADPADPRGDLTVYSKYVDVNGKVVYIDSKGIIHRIALEDFRPSLPGQSDSVGAADAKNSPVKSVPEPPKSAPVPPGGLDENALDNLVQALVGSTETISAGLNQLRLKPASYDHQTIATQLVRYASCTQCVKCGTWAQVSNINNPRCAHYPNCGA